MAIKFLVCVSRDGLGDFSNGDLALGRLYEAVEPEDSREMVRVIDDSGEDNLYPAKLFEAVEVLASTVRHIEPAAYHAAVVSIGIHTLFAVVTFWRSVSACTGHKLFKYGMRTIAAFFSIVGLVANAAVLEDMKPGIEPAGDPGRLAEKMAIASQTHPTAGFWKSDCANKFGLAIAPAEDAYYSISFCGPGGCFKPGSYRTNTPIVGDSNYQVVGANTLRLLGNEGWSTYVRAPGREESTCSPP